MIKNDLIKFDVNYNFIGKDFKMAMLGLEVIGEANWVECLSRLESLPWVIMGFRALGKSNLRVLIFGENDEILERNIDGFRDYHCVNFINVEVLGNPIVGNA
jgi:hypothetical protein